jgi:hypothetical protein
MNITKEQLPLQQFERLGMNQERINKLPKMKWRISFPDFRPI